MASVVINGDTSGSITLSAPAVAGSNTLSLPANTGTIITTASSGQSIPKAALPTGSVLQVVSQQNGQTLTSTSSAVTLLTQSFTPTSASSKVLAIMNFCVERLGGSGANYIFITLNRNGTPISASGMSSNWANAPGYQLSNGARSTGSHAYLDSPATTSAITYSLVGNFTDSGNVPWQFYILNLTLMEIAA